MVKQEGLWVTQPCSDKAQRDIAHQALASAEASWGRSSKWSSAVESTRASHHSSLQSSEFTEAAYSKELILPSNIQWSGAPAKHLP